MSADLRRGHPCDAADAPATCPAPGFRPNYLGVLNPRTGHVSTALLTGRPQLHPKGVLLSLPGTDPSQPNALALRN